MQKEQQQKAQRSTKKRRWVAISAIIAGVMVAIMAMVAIMSYCCPELHEDCGFRVKGDRWRHRERVRAEQGRRVDGSQSNKKRHKLPATRQAELGEIAVSVSQQGVMPAERAEVQLVIETWHQTSLAKAQQLNSQVSRQVRERLEQKLQQLCGGAAHDRVSNHLSTIDLRAGAQYQAVTNASSQSANGPINQSTNRNRASDQNVINVVHASPDQRALIGYQVMHRLKLKTNQLIHLPELLQVALEAGVTKVERLSFHLDEQNDACRQLQAPAMRLLRQRAEGLASLAGSRLLGVKNLHAQCIVKDYAAPLYYRASSGSVRANGDNGGSALDSENGDATALVLLAKARDASMMARDIETELQIQAQWYIE